MGIKKRGYCPFRVLKGSFEAGCALQLGRGVRCYSQDHLPLLSKDKEFFCPQLHFKLSQDTYSEIHKIITSILTIQDEENTAINLWPIFSRNSKITNPSQAQLGKGIEMQKISEKVRKELDEIVLNLS